MTVNTNNRASRINAANQLDNCQRAMEMLNVLSAFTTQKAKNLRLYIHDGSLCVAKKSKLRKMRALRFFTCLLCGPKISSSSQKVAAFINAQIPKLAKNLRNFLPVIAKKTLQKTTHADFLSLINTLTAKSTKALRKLSPEEFTKPITKLNELSEAIRTATNTAINTHGTTTRQINTSVQDVFKKIHWDIAKTALNKARTSSPFVEILRSSSVQSAPSIENLEAPASVTIPAEEIPIDTSLKKELEKVKQKTQRLLESKYQINAQLFPEAHNTVKFYRDRASYFANLALKELFNSKILNKKQHIKLIIKDAKMHHNLAIWTARRYKPPTTNEGSSGRYDTSPCFESRRAARLSNHLNPIPILQINQVVMISPEEGSVDPETTLPGAIENPTNYEDVS